MVPLPRARRLLALGDPGQLGVPCAIEANPTGDHPISEEQPIDCPKCGAPLVLRPVPGAKQFPRRLECPQHGWTAETPRPIRMRFHKDRPDW
ncbi:MAG TPA: hypothetical protein VN861_12220 [Candidatus Acidoferrales bacterium]|nr:hypothetical protein [Candidatus Acidoferrales bacterium]